MRDLRVSTQYTGLSSFYLLLCIGGGEKLNTIDLVGSFFLTTSLPNFILPVTWTLQYELYFYFFFALLIFVTKEYRIKIIILTLVIILVVQSYAIFHLDIYAPNNFHTTSRLYIFWLSPFVIEFLLGVFVAYYFEHARIKHLFPLIFGIILLIIGALYYQNHMISGSLEQGYYMPQRVVFFGIISMLLLALMIELNQRNINIFPKISILLGNASYSLYLSHTILLLIAYGLGIRNAIKDFGAYQGELMILLIGSIILYSLLHYKFIELPLLNLSKKIRNTLFH
jgi:peptidoglycan/LPS O-acetylase OafA/YrhL